MTEYKDVIKNFSDTRLQNTLKRLEADIEKFSRNCKDTSTTAGLRKKRDAVSEEIQRRKRKRAGADETVDA